MGDFEPCYSRILWHEIVYFKTIIIIYSQVSDDNRQGLMIFYRESSPIVVEVN